MRDSDRAVAFGGDHGLGLGGRDQLAQVVGIVSLVCNDTGRVAIGEKLGGGGAVVRLSGGEDEAQRTALSIGEGVDFVVNPPRERPTA